MSGVGGRVLVSFLSLSYPNESSPDPKFRTVTVDIHQTKTCTMVHVIRNRNGRQLTPMIVNKAF